MADGHRLENIEKLSYLGLGLTDVDEIWHSDAVRPFLSRPTVKISKKNKKKSMIAATTIQRCK